MILDFVVLVGATWGHELSSPHFGINAQGALEETKRTRFAGYATATRSLASKLRSHGERKGETRMENEGVPEMKEIPLTQGKVALVDDEDFEKLNNHKWYAMRSHLSGGLNPDTFYAVRKIRTPLGGRLLRMHRFILGSKPGEQVDHIDSNGLNNQKANLRKCDAQQNAGNRRHANSNGFKGIAFLKRPLSKPWLAHIKFNGRLMHIGYYKTKIEAALAYDKKAMELFGEFAKPNII